MTDDADEDDPVVHFDHSYRDRLADVWRSKLQPAVEWRRGGGWQQIFVNGVLRGEGHELSPADWRNVLEALGATVVEPPGDFCTDCGRWIPRSQWQLHKC